MKIVVPVHNSELLVMGFYNMRNEMMKYKDSS